MRILPLDEHQTRKDKILQAVVHLFIKTGKPVGSSAIVKNFGMNLSPASIRNVLAELEKGGFLTHPHTSAGRIPTDKGYRFYVDTIVDIQRLAAEEEKRIHLEYSKKLREIEDLMSLTTRILSGLSHCTGFVLPPAPNVEKLRHVELVPVAKNRLLGVLVSESGVVRNQLIEVSQIPDNDSLQAATRFLNERLLGLNFYEAQGRLHLELDHYQTQWDIQRELLQRISTLFEEVQRQDIFVEGASNLLNFPEFHDYKSMRDFARLVDEKELLSRMLMNKIGNKGVQVQIGSEDKSEFRDLSVVSTGYQLNGRPVGILGILGPKRMEYARMIAIVESVSQVLNRFFEDNQRDFLDY